MLIIKWKYGAIILQSDIEINRWRIQSVNKIKLKSKNNEFGDTVKYCVNIFGYCKEEEILQIENFKNKLQLCQWC